MRQKDPDGISFIERTMIHRWEKEAKQRKEAEHKAKASRGRRR